MPLPREHTETPCPYVCSFASNSGMSAIVNLPIDVVKSSGLAQFGRLLLGCIQPSKLISVLSSLLGNMQNTS